MQPVALGSDELGALERLQVVRRVRHRLCDLACEDLDGARRHWRAYLSFDPNSRWADQVRRYLQINGER